MPELRFSDGVLLAQAVERLLPLAREGIINYTPEELTLVVSVPSGLLKAALQIKSSGFILFNCNVNNSARVNLEQLHVLLKRTYDEDPLTIYGGEEDYIGFLYLDPSIDIEDNVYNEMRLTQFHNENEDINEFQSHYEVVAEILSGRFRTIITELEQFGHRVSITVRDTQVIFKVEEKEIILSKANDECAINGVAEGNFISSMFNLNHVSSIRSASLLSRTVCIYVSETFNCLLSFEVAPDCFIRFYFPEE